MNGFTDAVLSFSLGWLKTFFNGILSFLSGNSTSTFFNVFADNWKVILLVICCVGFVIDKVIYIFRWRPYYVWKNKQVNIPAANKDAYPNTEENVLLDNTFQSELAPAQNTYSQYAPSTVQFSPMVNTTSGFAPMQQTSNSYHQNNQPFTSPQQYNNRPNSNQVSSKTNVYNSNSFAPTISYGAFQNPIEIDVSSTEARFDEDIDTISNKANNFFAPPMQQNAKNMATINTRSFSPEIENKVNNSYNNISYAPQYSPKIDPINPGLDYESIDRNFRINNSQEDSIDNKTAKSSAIENFAKKARSFVIGADENPPTLNDIRSNVNSANAFRAPAYPKRNNVNGEKNEDT